MTEDALIEAAKAHVKFFKSVNAGVEKLTKTRFRDAAVIYFGADDPSDYVKIVVDRATGEVIEAIYTPEN